MNELSFEIEDCDYDGPASIYYSKDLGRYICRCLVCARCSKHTGNSNYGHYTRACKNLPAFTSTKEWIKAMEDIPHHFCCPDDCALEND